MMTKSNVSKHLTRLGCLVLGAVFIISSVAKFMNFSDTISYFWEFRVIGLFAAYLISSLLVSMEVVLGVALVAEKKPVKPLLVCAGVMAAFTIYQLVLMLFPATFTRTCPCFGASAAAIHIQWLPLLRNVFLTGLAVACYLFYKRKGSDGESLAAQSEASP